MTLQLNEERENFNRKVKKLGASSLKKVLKKITLAEEEQGTSQQSRSTEKSRMSRTISISYIN